MPVSTRITPWLGDAVTASERRFRTTSWKPYGVKRDLSDLFPELGFQEDVLFLHSEFIDVEHIPDQIVGAHQFELNAFVAGGVDQTIQDILQPLNLPDHDRQDFPL